MAKASPNRSVPDLPSGLLERLRDQPLLHLLLLALVAVAAYSNTFGVPFVLDDLPSIVENPVIRDLSGFLSGAGLAYRPRRFVGYLSFALNYRAGGVDVAGYHAVNLAIHTVSSCLVYLLARLTLAAPAFSPLAQEGEERSGRLHPVFFPLLAGLLFAAHPVQTEAVTYVVQRLASLCTMFYLMSLVLYLLARLEQRRSGRLSHPRALILFLACALCAALAFATKELSATLPLVVLLIELSFFGAGRRKRLLLLSPVLPGFLFLSWWVADPVRLDRLDRLLRMETGMDRLTYLATELRVIPTYLRLILLPVGQNLDYDYPVHHSFTDPPVLAGSMLILSLLTLALWLYRERPGGGGAGRIAAFGISWFFITLAVESSLIPILDVIFEHRLYLPSVGAFLAFAAVICRLLSRRPAALAITTALLTLALGSASFARNQVWGDTVSLWSDTAAKSPRKCRPHFNLAKALLLAGSVEEAQQEASLAVSLDPGNPEAHTNLAVILARRGLGEEALVHYRQAVELAPSYATARLNLGSALEGRGRLAEAAAEYREAVRLDPQSFEAHNNLGGALIRSGRLEEALGELTQAVRLEPGRVEPLTNLGVCCEKRGDIEGAIAYYREALRVQPGHASAHLNLGNALSRQGNITQAMESYREAIRLKPAEPAGHLNLGLAHLKRGALREAGEEFAAVQRVAPGEPVSRALLARMAEAPGSAAAR